MQEGQVGDVTTLLRAVSHGLPGAADRLFALVYDELRGLARGCANGHGVRGEPTTLVNEAYLRLFGRGEPNWENRRHFFFAASRAMRDILVDRVRRETAQKRGGGDRTLSLPEDIPAAAQPVDLLALNEALTRLETSHPEAAHVVTLRFFGGLTREQIARVMGISESAVWREWEFAKAWLHAELRPDPS